MPCSPTPGGEKPETYAYRDRFAAWLKGRGVPFCTVVGKYKYPTLEAECLGSKTLPSLSYGFKKCSLKWRRQPQDLFCNHWEPAQKVWAAGERVTKLVGYDAGEARRAAKTPLDDPKYAYRYPLIEMGIDRDGCIEAIQREGLDVPPKSSCFFCPSTRAVEILKMGETHPDLLQRALEIERTAGATVDYESNARNRQGVLGLGRRLNWGNLVKQDARQMSLFDSCGAAPEVPCDCTDGDDE